MVNKPWVGHKLMFYGASFEHTCAFVLSVVTLGSSGHAGRSINIKVLWKGKGLVKKQRGFVEKQNLIKN